jgi:uncharacterized lipoprotein
MKTTLVSFAVALALGMLAGCDRNQTSAQPATTGTTAPAGSGSSAQSNTPSTPANIGAPTQADKKDGGQPPVQGREDVRQPEQRRDFQQKGDGAGPKPGG